VADCGILTSYITGAEIRAASWSEWTRSVTSGPTGVYHDPVHGDVFVAGGPEISDTIPAKEYVKLDRNLHPALYH
jgi:hypothetical protein